MDTLICVHLEDMISPFRRINFGVLRRSILGLLFVFYFTRLFCSESQGFTRNEYRDEASFHRPMSKQDTGSEFNDEARFLLRPEARRRPVRCPAQAAVPSVLPARCQYASTRRQDLQERRIMN
ncbi:hypothetical protein FHG87_016459 [Trinorchestia longiramus]|nr:hypothetical protein FHG87_016459 [Trinorchestia longiramus]